MDLRLQQQIDFAKENDIPTDGWQALTVDASTRRYFRIPQTPFGPCLLMDDPGDPAGFEAFIRIARHLLSLGLSAPTVYASDQTTGLALIEDFGTGTYTTLLQQGQDETGLYELAIDALVVLHNSDAGRNIDLPSYDVDALAREVMLFAEWFAPQFLAPNDGGSFRRAYEALWRPALADVALDCDVLVLRDYHVDNLMLLPARDGVAACGLLDFQDGLIGSAAYDVMSLTQDARRDLSPGLEGRLLTRYFDARPGLNQKNFLRSYHVLAAQRHAKVAGIFQRLSQRDGKDRYLRHIPRVLRLFNQALNAAGLTELRTFLDDQIPGWTGWTPSEKPGQ